MSETNVTNIVHEDDSTVTLCWKLKSVKMPNTTDLLFGSFNVQESQSFPIDKLGNLCSLRLSCKAKDFINLGSNANSSLTNSKAPVTFGSNVQSPAGAAPPLCYPTRITPRVLEQSAPTPTLPLYFTFGTVNSIQHKVDSYDVTFEIKSHGDFSFFQYQSVQLIASADKTRKGHVFRLLKSCDDDTVLKSKVTEIFEPLFSTENKTFNLYIKIVTTKYDNKCSLLNDMSIMLNDKIYSDLKIEVENHVFDVHKCIISARSSVFSKMIAADMNEKQTGTIKLLDWDSFVVKELLNYIYTGKFQSPKISHKLFRLAHFLDMNELQDLCIKYLISNISKTNIVDILILVHDYKYSLEKLKKAAYTFVESNESDLVKCPNFFNYLTDYINSSNVIFVLNISNKYKLRDLSILAIKYVQLHRNTMIKFNECKKFFINNPELLWELFIQDVNSKETK